MSTWCTLFEQRQSLLSCILHPILSCLSLFSFAYIQYQSNFHVIILCYVNSRRIALRRIRNYRRHACSLASCGRLCMVAGDGNFPFVAFHLMEGYSTWNSSRCGYSSGTIHSCSLSYLYNARTWGASVVRFCETYEYS